MRNFKSVLSLALVSFALAACGQSETTGPTAGSPGYIPGGIIGGSSTNCSVFPYYTPYQSNTLTLNISNYALTPDNPCMGNVPTNLVVKAGDRVKVTFNSPPTWGYSTWDINHWGIFSYGHLSSDCSRVDVAGIDRITGITAGTNSGLPMGLLVSDGRNVYQIPTSGAQATMLEAGVLRVGFNVPMSLWGNSSCSSGTITLTINGA